MYPESSAGFILRFILQGQDESHSTDLCSAGFILKVAQDLSCKGQDESYSTDLCSAGFILKVAQDLSCDSSCKGQDESYSTDLCSAGFILRFILQGTG